MTNNNSTNNNIKNLIIAVGSIAIFIFTIISALWVGKEIGKAGSNLIEKFIKFINRLFKKKSAERKAEALKAAEPVLKQAIKNVKPIKFADLETMRSLDKIVKETVPEDQVPENIKEKIENEEASKTKTFINGKIYDKVDQFINECKELKRSRIGSHKVIVGNTNLAKKIKSKLTEKENEFIQFYKDMGHDPDRLSCINFMNYYFTWVNEYIDLFDCYCDKVSFEETDAIINKYFGE